MSLQLDSGSGDLLVDESTKLSIHPVHVQGVHVQVPYGVLLVR